MLSAQVLADAQLALQVEVVAGLIRQIGLAPTKAKNIIATSQVRLRSSTVCSSAVRSSELEPLTC